MKAFPSTLKRLGEIRAWGNRCRLVPGTEPGKAGERLRPSRVNAVHPPVLLSVSQVKRRSLPVILSQLPVTLAVSPVRTPHPPVSGTDSQVSGRVSQVVSPSSRFLERLSRVEARFSTSRRSSPRVKRMPPPVIAKSLPLKRTRASALLP